MLGLALATRSPVHAHDGWMDGCVVAVNAVVDEWCVVSGHFCGCRGKKILYVTSHPNDNKSLFNSGDEHEHRLVAFHQKHSTVLVPSQMNPCLHVPLRHFGHQQE